MFSSYDPSPPIAAVTFDTFEQWPAVPDSNDPNDHIANMTAINAAIDWSSRTRENAAVAVRGDALLLSQGADTRAITNCACLGLSGSSAAGSGVRPLAGGTATFPSQYVVTRKATNVQLLGLRLDGSTASQPVVIGDNGPCRSVVLGDVSLTRLVGQTGSAVPASVGVLFDSAVACGFVRGAIAGSDNAYAVSFAGQADGCYVEDADLTGIRNQNGLLIDIATAKRFRLTNNAYAAGQPLQRSSLGLGPPMPTNLTSNTITVASSSVELVPSPNTALSTIRTASTTPAGRSLAGNVLVLTAASGSTVTVNDNTGNIRLQNTANIPLVGANGDTLTLLCRGSDWVQIAYSKNV